MSHLRDIASLYLSRYIEEVLPERNDIRADAYEGISHFDKVVEIAGTAVRATSSLVSLT